LTQWLGALPDRRDRGCCDYSNATLAWTIILMYLGRLGARRDLANNQVHMLVDRAALAAFKHTRRKPGRPRGDRFSEKDVDSSGSLV
jgi:hypothetical protein